jgi:hypothetical protein
MHDPVHTLRANFLKFSHSKSLLEYADRTCIQLETQGNRNRRKGEKLREKCSPFMFVHGILSNRPPESSKLLHGKVPHHKIHPQNLTKNKKEFI